MKDALGHGSEAQNGAAAAALAGGHPKSGGVPVHPAHTLQSAVAGFNSAAGKWAGGITAAAAQQAKDVAKLPKLKSSAEVMAEIEKIWSPK